MVPLDRRGVLHGILAASAGLALGVGAAAQERRIHRASLRDASDFVGRIGVNVHLAQKGSVYDRDFETSIVAAIQDLGLSQIRQGVYTPVPGTTDVLYGRIRDLARLGCRFSAVCNDPSDRYVTTPPAVLAQIYEECAGAIDIVEGGNEPELARDPLLNPTLSWMHQRGLHDAIRRDLSGSRIALASPSYIQGNIALAKPLAGLVDRSNLHPYPGMEHPETRGPGRLAGFREAMIPVCGDVASLITETGYHTALGTASGHLPVSEATRARYMPRLLLLSYLSGMQRTFLYELRSSFDRGPADPESAFGLLTFGGKPTPGYHAVKSLIALFSRPQGASGTGAGAEKPSPEFATTGDHADVMAAQFRRGDGAVLMPVWLGVPGWDSNTRTTLPPTRRRLRLACGAWRGAVTAHRFDDDGRVRAEPLPLADGSADLVVSDRLTVLEFRV